MSLTLIDNPTSSLTLSSQWTDFVNREDHSNIGVGTSIPIFRLTNWDTGTARPLVAEGAIVEVGGSLYQADSDTALVDDTGLVDGLCFIKLVPGTGTPDPTTVVPTLTSDTMPAFDAEQGGWYDGDNKFLPILMTRASSGTSYTNKGEYVDQNQNVIRYIDGGTYLAGAAQVGGALTVGAGATFNGAVSGITDLTTSGALTVNGAVSGVTDLTTSGALTVNGAVSGVTDLTTSGALTVNGAVSGVTSLSMSGVCTNNGIKRTVISEDSVSITTTPITIATVASAFVIYPFWEGPSSNVGRALNELTPNSSVYFKTILRGHAGNLETGDLLFASYSLSSNVDRVFISVTSAGAVQVYSDYAGTITASFKVIIEEVL